MCYLTSFFKLLLCLQSFVLAPPLDRIPPISISWTIPTISFDLKQQAYVNVVHCSSWIEFSPRYLISLPCARSAKPCLLSRRNFLLCVQGKQIPAIVPAPSAQITLFALTRFKLCILLIHWTNFISFPPHHLRLIHSRGWNEPFD